MVDEWRATRIHGLISGQLSEMMELGSTAYLFGWKAMPFALEDLDSNCRKLVPACRPLKGFFVTSSPLSGAGGHQDQIDRWPLPSWREATVREREEKGERSLREPEPRRRASS